MPIADVLRLLLLSSPRYRFYFPHVAPGGGDAAYRHFPVHVGAEEALVAFAEPTAVRVVAELGAVDARSWAHVAARGADADVLRFLREEPLAAGTGVDLSLCAWRMRDAGFCRAALAALSARFAYDETLWGYGAGLHKDAARLAEMLPRGGGAFSVAARGGVGPAFRSRLLTVDPVFALDAEHLEYSPLMNARAHKVGAARTVPNLSLRRSYARLLARVAHRPASDARSHHTT